MRKKRFAIKIKVKKRDIHQPFVRSIPRPFDFARVDCNATPTPRSPLLDAFLVKILVLYCSTLINVRNARPPAASTRFFGSRAILLPCAVTYPISVSKKWSLTTGGGRWMDFLFRSTHVCTTQRIYDKEIIIKVLWRNFNMFFIRCDLFNMIYI